MIIHLEKTRINMKVGYKEYEIEILDDKDYSTKSADNIRNYKFEYSEGKLITERIHPTSKHGIRVKEKSKVDEFSSAIICEFGGGTTIHEKSYFIDDYKIWICACNKIYCLNLPHKYIGFLNGKLGQFDDAKSAIHEAIAIYSNQEFEQVVAVSQINLAGVYFREKEYDESIKYFSKSKDFWTRINDLGRIYTDNILGVKIYAEMERAEEVDMLIKENKEIEKEINVNTFVKTKFDELLREIKNNAIR